MPRVVTKQLDFPLSGVARRRGYREQATAPYAAPWAVNVRGESPLEHRKRGGSRPGLAKYCSAHFGTKITAVVPLTYIDGSGDRQHDLIIVADGAFYVLHGTTASQLPTNLIIDAGVTTVITDDGEEIIFPATASSVNPVGDTDAFDAVEKDGKLYLADSVLRSYNPLTGVVDDIQASEGVIPTGCPLICLFRNRIFLAGVDNVWYASRQGDVTDWDFGADMNDVGRATAGHIGRAGRIGDVIQAMIPYGDSVLTMATRNEMVVYRGDPASDGTMAEVNSEIGILSPTAWARTGEGLVAFLSSDGVYLFDSAAGSRPVAWSGERVPDELKDIDPETNIITMTYEAKWRGFHLFVTPDSGLGSHWWLDLDKKALWPVRVPDGQQPVASARLQGTSGMSEDLFACKDGYLRKYDDDAEDDDGEPIESHVLLGPVRLSSDDMTDAVLAEIHGVLADNSGTVNWHVLTGKSAEAVTDAAVDAIVANLAGEATFCQAGGEWTENRNLVERPKARGPWVIVWLASVARWAYDSVALRINQLGRLR